MLSIALLLCLVFSLNEANAMATWKSEPQAGTIPGPRSSAGMAKLDDSLYVFCGYLECNGGSFCASAFYNDVFQYDFQTNSWSQPILTSVDAPANRTFFPYVTDSSSDSFILYGGLNFNLPNVNVFGDLWRYFVKTNSWVQLAQYNTGPGQRAGAGMVLLGNLLYVGFGLDQTVFGPSAGHNDLWTFNLTSGLWTLLITDNSSNPGQPYHRYRPMFQLDDKQEKILVYSGDMPLGDPVLAVNDTWEYDIASGVWTLLNVNGIQFGNRQDAVSTVYGKTFLVMFGDTETPGSCGNNVTGNNDNPQNTLWQMDLKHLPTASWSQFSTNSNPGGLKRSSSTRDDNKFYMWSGYHFLCNVPENGTIVYETGLFSLNLNTV